MEEEVDKGIALYQDIQDGLRKVTESVDDILSKVNKGEIKPTNGISFLDLKYHMLLNYLINLTYIIAKKCTGSKIEDDFSIFYQAEIRTVLEKLRPIEMKLKYQIDKILKTSTTNTKSNDPLQYKANAENLMEKFPNNEEDDDDDDDDGGLSEKRQEPKQKLGIYVPPKLSAMHYDGDEERNERHLERAKSALLSSSIMRELREEYSEAPEEIHEGFDNFQNKASKGRKEIQNYEEENMLRLNISKKQKNKFRDLASKSSFSGITDFGDMRSLNTDIDTGPMNKRKRSFQPGKRKFKTFRKQGKRKR